MLVCNSTGATAFTCGSLPRMPPTLIDRGAPVAPRMIPDPGGRTMASAPIPDCRSLLSFNMPNIRPTITSMSVTSMATAKMLINDRIGRCTRLETIILFMHVFYGTQLTCAESRWNLSRVERRKTEIATQIICRRCNAPSAQAAFSRACASGEVIKVLIKASVDDLPMFTSAAAASSPNVSLVSSRVSGLRYLVTSMRVSSPKRSTSAGMAVRQRYPDVQASRQPQLAVALHAHEAALCGD